MVYRSTVEPSALSEEDEDEDGSAGEEVRAICGYIKNVSVLVCANTEGGFVSAGAGSAVVAGASSMSIAVSVLSTGVRDRARGLLEFVGNRTTRRESGLYSNLRRKRKHFSTPALRVGK